MNDFKNIKIAVAGTGYVGLSIATLLSQHHHVTAVDVIPEKVEKLNKRISPIQDEYIEKYLAEKPLNLTATLDGKVAYKNADFVVIAAPTNYDPGTAWCPRAGSSPRARRSRWRKPGGCAQTCRAAIPPSSPRRTGS